MVDPAAYAVVRALLRLHGDERAQLFVYWEGGAWHDVRAEEIELTEPWKAVLEAGWTPRLVSTELGRVQAMRHLDKAGTYAVDRVLTGRTEESFDALVLPGGVANPDALRANASAVSFARGFFESGKRWRRYATALGCWWRRTSWATAR